MELELKEFKDVELESIGNIIIGMKIVMAGTLMLENAEKMIHELKGLTLKEEAEVDRKKRKDTT